MVLLREGRPVSRCSAAEGQGDGLRRRDDGVPRWGVDERDADASVAWAGPGPQWWAERFGCSPRWRGPWCARRCGRPSGVRVLLAGPDEQRVVADTRPYAEARTALVSRELSLARFLEENSLVLRADLLRPWANWVTPEEEPPLRHQVLPRRDAGRAARRRGDLGGGGGLLGDSAAALQDWAEGKVPAAPADPRDVDRGGRRQPGQRLARGAELVKILPKMIKQDGRWRIVLPGEPGYQEER